MRGLSGVTAFADRLTDAWLAVCAELWGGDGITWTGGISAGGQQWSVTWTCAPARASSGRGDPLGVRM
jgi:hypothetical protein